MTTANDAIHRPHTAPDFIVALGLALPVTVEDVEEAYRARAKTAHPDAGGNNAQFVALQQAYERALEYAQFRTGRSRWLGAAVDRYLTQEELIARIRELGGAVRTEKIDWLVNSIGEDFSQLVENVVSVALTGSEVYDHVIDWLIEHANVLASLRTLDLYQSRVTDAGLRRLKALPSLRMLNVRQTRITPAGLEVMADLPVLEQVLVGGTRVSWLARFALRRRFPEVRIQA